MSDDSAARLRQTGLTPSHESDLQVVHGLAAELRDIVHDHARHDGFVKFSGTRWMSYYHSLDRILMEHDRRQAEIYKYADEIERLRRELGQVSDADSWVSEADAAHLDSLLNWCEFNDMESHRALQRLVNDRARLRGEVTRLRGGGCARDQTTTQFCAEAVFLQGELDTSRKRCRELMIRQGEMDAEMRRVRSEQP